MDSSSVKHIPVSSPYTFNMNRIHVPPKVLVPPVFYPASWEREGSSSSSPDDSQESDSESLDKERQSQLGLQQRILENEELVGLGPDDSLENDSLEEDSLEEMSSEEKEAEDDTDMKGKQKNYSSERIKQPVDKYSSLRYDPDWKSTEKGAELFEAAKPSQLSGGSSGDFSVNSFYLHCDGGGKNQQEAKIQDSFSEFDPELFSFHGANVGASNEALGPQAKRREPADAFHSKDSPGRAPPPQIQQNPPQKAKKNFVKKNKRTLGLQSERRNSYLELHNKKQQVLQGQVTDPATVDEEPLQSVPPLQTGTPKPEDKWYPKGQQLKEQHKISQRNKTESNQTLSERAFPRNDGQQPSGRAAEPKSSHHLQIPEFQAAPTAVEQDSSRALQECLNPGSTISPDPAEKPKPGLNNLPTSTPTSTCPLPPIFPNFNPAEVLYSVYPSKESWNYQQDSPYGIPHEQQYFTNLIPGQNFSRDGSTSGQAHPNLRNLSSYFNGGFEERVKDPASLQDFKNHIHEDNSSPTASCGISECPELPERYLARSSGLRGEDFTDKWIWSLLPPGLSQLQGGSQGYPGGAEGNPGKMRRSSSEGSVLKMEKQNQPKGSKKLCSSKFYINVNMKPGGLGPDYEAIKEKKQKVKLQKEYSQQIKEYNMKNITVVQRSPMKLQVPSVSRQKALDYAKKIPRPKTFTAKQPEQEVKEEKVLPQARTGTSLPQIPSLETLWNRHEKEKEVVAAFKALHIL